MPLLIVPIQVPAQGVDAALLHAQEAKARGADFIEWRVDALWQSLLESAPELHAIDISTDQGAILTINLTRHLLAHSPCASILTCRAAREGGLFDGPDSLRLALLRACCDATKLPPGHTPAFVDIEWSSIAPANAPSRTDLSWLDGADASTSDKPRLLCSLHDPIRKPTDLARRTAAMASDPRVAAIKIAHHARSLHDALDTLHLAPSTGKPTIALAMGECGALTRTLAPKAGSFATFAALHPSLTTAPGQPTLDELTHAARFRSMSRATRVYGIMGWPVSRSLSPTLHNALFAQASVNAVYVRLPVQSYDDAVATDIAFRATLEELIEDSVVALCGASVTMPHKSRLAGYVRAKGGTLDAPTEATGVANTLLVHRDVAGRVTRLEALNTDALAFKDLLTIALAQGVPERPPSSPPVSVAILGSGATARSAAWAALQLGFSVHVYAREVANARSLAHELSQHAAGEIHPHPLSDLPHAHADIIIQCTPLGTPGSEVASLSALPSQPMHAMPRHTCVIETVMHPSRTPTLAAAAERDWTCVDASELFTRQAILQSRAWLQALANPQTASGRESHAAPGEASHVILPQDLQHAAAIVRRALAEQASSGPPLPPPAPGATF